MSWSAAEEKCIGKGGHLASILDWYEQAHVFAQAGSDSTWIGLSNVEVSKVKLIQSLFTPQPNRSKVLGQEGSEKCIWKIFYRALFELGHQEVPEVHDPLEVP